MKTIDAEWDIEIYFDDIIVNNIPYPIYVGSDES